MINLINFEKKFNGYKIPQELIDLIEFQNDNENEFGYSGYSSCFWLEDRTSLLKYYSTDPEFLNALFPFAKADGSGSFYAFWNNKQTTNLEKMPIVVFGSEGGEFVVAENILILLKILTFNSEPDIYYDKGISFNKSDSTSTNGSTVYKKWLKTKYNIDLVENPNELIKVANEKYQNLFDSWKKEYLNS